MSLRPNLFGHGAALAMTAAAIIAVATIVTSKSALAQTASTQGVRSIDSGSDAAKKLKEPSHMTREDLLNAKPLDWNATSGKPKPRTLTPAEQKALRDAKPGQSAGGAPDPNADEEARKQHLDDWK